MLRNIPNRIDQVGSTLSAQGFMLTAVGNAQVNP